MHNGNQLQQSGDVQINYGAIFREASNEAVEEMIRDGELPPSYRRSRQKSRVKRSENNATQ